MSRQLLIASGMSSSLYFKEEKVSFPQIRLPTQVLKLHPVLMSSPFPIIKKHGMIMNIDTLLVDAIGSNVCLWYGLPLGVREW